MLILRILAGLLVALLGLSFTLFIVTGDRRWLRFATRSLILFMGIALIILILFFLERVFVLS